MDEMKLLDMVSQCLSELRDIEENNSEPLALRVLLQDMYEEVLTMNCPEPEDLGGDDYDYADIPFEERGLDD